MENQLFRKKSLERISSPEEMHDYMRVTNPRLWMLLTAIAVLLAGFIVYASTAKLENTLKITVTVESAPSEETAEGAEAAQEVISAVLESRWKDEIKTGMEVRIGEKRGKVGAVVFSADGENQEVCRILIDPEDAGDPLPEGDYEAVLVLEASTPISFLWN